MKKNKFFFLIMLTTFIMLPFNANAMQIFVEYADAENITLEVESSATIYTVKSKIQNNTGFLVETQKLEYNNIELDNGRTLADYEIQASSTINLQILTAKVILDANGGKFTDSEQYVVNDYYIEEFVEPTREGYTFKGWYTDKEGGKIIEYYLEDNEIEDNMTFYAHWDKKGITTVDFTTYICPENWTDIENEVFNLIVDKGMLIASENKLYNKNNKLLLTYEDEGKVIFANDISSSDNIVYALTEEDKETIQLNNKIISIPNVVEIIFLKENGYKVTFDANGGTFKDSDKYIIEKWENKYYDSLTTPTRKGYKFLGYFTRKNSGTKLEMVLNESGIDSDITFYAQWKLVEENPKTYDGIGNSMLLAAISLIGLTFSIIYLNKKSI